MKITIDKEDIMCGIPGQSNDCAVALGVNRLLAGRFFSMVFINPYSGGNKAVVAIHEEIEHGITHRVFDQQLHDDVKQFIRDYDRYGTGIKCNGIEFEAHIPENCLR